jgi:hypothetical protein
MSPKTFDRETMLDLTVNIIPLGIVLFFIVAFALVNPFGWDPVVSTLQFAIMGVTAILLTILTYVAGKAISEAEAEMEAAEGSHSNAGAEPVDDEATA